MKTPETLIRDGLYSFLVMAVAFAVNLLFQIQPQIRSLIPMIFVLGTFLISLKTQGYLWGVLASILGVFAVNYAFTLPYFAFNFSLPESVFSALVMFTVALSTSALTTKIKEQEKMRSESEKEKMRANLLRAISHDLRTPLTSIYGSASVLLENYDDLPRERQFKMLEEMRKDSEWLIRMVENLLSVTRIDGEKVQVIKTPTVLEELIDSTLVKFRKRYPEQQVTVSIPPDFISIPMDGMLIEQVLINLLENAALHARGMTELTLIVRTGEGRVVFEVSDNGCGIPRERLEHLFAGYLEHTHAPADSGRSNMGIGLSVCATIVRAHGGVLQAENRPEGGARFWFSLEMEGEDT